MLTVRDAVPKAHVLAKAEFATLRIRLLKIGAGFRETAHRVRIAFAAACPDAALVRDIAAALRPAPALPAGPSPETVKPLVSTSTEPKAKAQIPPKTALREPVPADQRPPIRRAVSSAVESRKGAVAAPRFPSPLIKPDVPISGIRLSDRLHRTAIGGGPMCTRRRRRTPPSP